MRKEVFWAIFAGILFGLIIAFGVVRVNSTLKPKGEKVEVSVTPKGINNEFKIVLAKPENEDVVTKEPIEISGITKPLSWVIISAEKNDYLILSNEQGAFQENIELTSGVNQIKITAIDSSKLKSLEKVIVVYSSAFEEKGGDRLEKATNKPKAYLGTVTDITGSTVQIKSMSDEIKQISVEEEVVVVKTTPTNKVVKLGDIAIGDFIAAMGYRNGNQVLNAQRILITPAVSEPKIDVVMGQGSNVIPTKTTQVLSFKDGKVVKVKASALEDESQIIYVTTEVDSKSSLRSIFIIS